MNQLNTFVCLVTGLALGSGAPAQSGVSGNAAPTQPAKTSEAAPPLGEASSTHRSSTHLCGTRPPITNLAAWSAFEACRKASINHAPQPASSTTVASTTRFYGVPQRRTRFAIR